MNTRMIVALAFVYFSINASAQNSFQETQSQTQTPITLYEAAQSSFNYSSLPSVPTFSSKAQTIGSQYLFETWVPGSVIDYNGVEFSEGYLFNYNKITQNIYIRLKDSAAAFLVHKNLLRSVMFLDGSNKIIFEKVASLDSNNFYHVLSKGPKYSLYKFTRTNFIASNFFTNGVSSSGNMYDEFKDESTYYLVTTDGKTSIVPLKRKSVKSLFAAEKEKVNSFFRENDTVENSFGEKFLGDLVNYLNRQD